MDYIQLTLIHGENNTKTIITTKMKLTIKSPVQDLIKVIKEIAPYDINDMRLIFASEEIPINE